MILILAHAQKGGGLHIENGFYKYDLQPVCCDAFADYILRFRADWQSPYLGRVGRRVGDRRTCVRLIKG